MFAVNPDHPESAEKSEKIFLFEMLNIHVNLFCKSILCLFLLLLHAEMDKIQYADRL